MSQRIEQAAKHKSGKYHAFLKRMARRVMRRLGKQQLDDAPTRYPFKGYVDDEHAPPRARR